MRIGVRIGIGTIGKTNGVPGCFSISVSRYGSRMDDNDFGLVCKPN